jgi:hypothetical protein
MGEGTYGENKECPIIEEIEIINRSEYEQFIFIDDARLFLSPPPPPHEIEQWPDINLVLSTLSSAKTHRYIVIIEDVIIAVPVFAKSILAQTCQEINKRIWKEYVRQQQMPTKIEKGIDLIAQDLPKIIKSPQKIINHILRRLK